jgi:hypothetical protein
MSLKQPSTAEWSCSTQRISSDRLHKALRLRPAPSLYVHGFRSSNGYAVRGLISHMQQGAMALDISMRRGGESLLDWRAGPAS